MELVEVRARVSDRQYSALKELSRRYNTPMAVFLRIALSQYLSKKGMYHND